MTKDAAPLESPRESLGDGVRVSRREGGESEEVKKKEDEVEEEEARPRLEGRPDAVRGRPPRPRLGAAERPNVDRE